MYKALIRGLYTDISFEFIKNDGFIQIHPLTYNSIVFLGLMGHPAKEQKKPTQLLNKDYNNALILLKQL